MHGPASPPSPRPGRAAYRAGVTAAPTSDPGRPARLVVVEDEALVRLDLVEMLRAEGHDVVGEAGDGDSALAVVLREQPDLVLLDVRVPGPDGLEVARRVREGSRAGVLLLTAFRSPALVAEAAEAGVLGYLVKPATAADVGPAVAVALARRDQLLRLAEEVSDLSARLEGRTLVERAKGRLMRDRGLGEDEAYAVLRRASMDARTSLVAVARLVCEDAPETSA